MQTAVRLLDTDTGEDRLLVQRPSLGLLLASTWNSDRVAFRFDVAQDSCSWIYTLSDQQLDSLGCAIAPFFWLP